MFLGVMTATNPSGSSHSTLLQKQMSFKTSVGANQLFKNDDVDMIESGHTDAASMSMRYKSVICITVKIVFHINFIKQYGKAIKILWPYI